MIQILILEIILILVKILLPQSALAVCPACTIAVGAGLGLSRFFGIDDTVSSIWIGGFLVSSSFWFADWASKKWSIKLRRYITQTLSLILFWSLTFISLYYTGVLFHPFNKIYGVDKLIFGSVIGILTFLLSIFLDKKVRKLKGTQLFSYQKVAFPLILLAIASLIFYFITR